MGEFTKNQAITPQRSRRAAEVLAENIEMLIRAAPENRRSNAAFAKWCGVGNGTIDRLRKQDAAARISTLEKIAARFDLDPWHLLVPNLSLTHKPHLIGESERELYSRLEGLVKELKDDPPGNDGQKHEPQGKRIAHRRAKKG